jgi:hypothetical protein
VLTEFTPSSDAQQDVLNWKLSKSLVYSLGVCQSISAKPFLGATPEFFALNATRTLNMEKVKAHYIFNIKLDLVTMGNWSQTLFTIKYNDVITFSGQYSITNFDTAQCFSYPSVKYKQISIENDKETKNEKLIKIALNDFNSSVNGFWGIRNVIVSFMICGAENTEYDSSSKKCECTSGFYLDSYKNCVVCPLGCVCSKIKPCLSCKFNFMTLSASSDYCYIAYGKLI